MTPTIIGTAELYLGDCREVLAGLPAASVDVVLADPPYGDTSLEWDSIVPGWLPAAARVLKPTGSLWVFGSMRFLAPLFTEADALGFKYSQDIVWEKQNGTGFHADRFRRKQRPAHTGHIDASHYVSEDGGPRMMRSVLAVRNEHGRAIHPTQKPVELLRPLVRYSCPLGGVVLDPFSGSASAGEAALLEGRRFVGIEKKPNHFADGRDRIALLHDPIQKPLFRSAS